MPIQTGEPVLNISLLDRSIKEQGDKLEKIRRML